MSGKRYSRLVFDVDGTLIDSESAIVLGMMEFLRLNNLPVGDYEQISKSAFGQTPKAAFEAIGAGGDLYEQGNSFVNDYMYESGRTTVFEGVRETLAELFRRGVPMAVCTSRGPYEFEKDTVFPEIAPYFSVIMSNDYAERAKPFPDPLLKYMSQVGVGADELLYVGDSAVDRECTRAAGVDLALALWGAHDPSIEAEIVLKRPSDLLELF